ncbi:MAG TPA: class I SAM-dependent methyltransferase [Oligoflexia bacterium]|nr:class I SAM-dependent methyltransferase [Oligoflexia bacterium]
MNTLPEDKYSLLDESNSKAGSNKTTSKTSEGIGKESEIYTSRFSPAQEKVREETWDILVSEFFQNYVSPDDCLLDLGAGDGLFVTRIKARRRIAVDLSSHVNKLESAGIEVLQCLASDFVSKLNEPADVIFMSNFLEHLPDKRTVIEVFDECRRALSPDGKVLILQPNIRYVGVKYWDYIDHHIALTEHSLVEGLEVSGFRVEELIPRFLPYTAKSGVGAISGMFDTKSLVSAYLKIPLLWKFLGAQTFICARKK